MLQHEQEQPTGTPAAQIRVTSEELAQAINALEASKDEAARHLAGTVPIGEVVQELKLEATPEDIWAQVQKQRTQAAEEEAGRVRAAAMPVVPAAQDARSTRLRVRGWRRVARGWQGMKGWLWILFWCSGGMGLISSALHPSHTVAPGIHVDGNDTRSTYNVHHEDAEIKGNDNNITLRGDVRRLTVNGNDNTVTVLGTVEAVTVHSNGSQVHWTQEPPGKTIEPAVSGNDNQVGPSAP